MQGLLGTKLGMTQLFGEGDRLIPVTVILAGPCVVTQIKTQKIDGYDAIQIGYGDRKAKHVNKPQKGHFAKAKTDAVRYLREFRVQDTSNYTVGQALTVESFTEGERTDVSSNSKGKGFTGVMKRWNFRGGPGGHGAHFHRSPGSIGAAATPSRVTKGTKMAGRHGNTKSTVTNLKVIKIDVDRNMILVKGTVPGPNGQLVAIEKTKKAARKK